MRVQSQKFSPRNIHSVLCRFFKRITELGKGLVMVDLYRKLGIIKQTSYRWKREYGEPGLFSNRV